ncbi:MAG: hypothetical protein U0164_24700 [Gemmatimonadaceae bacterium]
MQGAPAVVGDLVVFSVVGGTEFGVNRFTRELAWTYTSLPIQATVAQTESVGSIVYHDAGDQTIVALQAATGAVVWKGGYGGQAVVDFLGTDRAVYVSVARDLVVLDCQSGREVQRVRRGSATASGIVASPAIFADGRIYAVADNALLCLKER